MKTRVGSTVITSVYEQDVPDLVQFIPSATSAAVSQIPWLRPNFVDAQGEILGVVQSFVVEHGGKLIVVDTCVGDNKDIPLVEAWSHRHTGFLSRFAGAGFHPAAVDYVLCSHMHLDHVGWNTHLDKDTWEPTFPNARYLFARAELDHWAPIRTEPTADRSGPVDGARMFAVNFRRTQVNVYDQSIKPIIDAGLAEIVDPPCEPLAGLNLVATPGHTPGHVIIEIESQGEKAVISGDSFHHPCQIAHPEWAATPDTDQEASTETRWRILRELADTATVLIGTHFTEPVLGRIVSDDTAYRFDTR